MRCTGVSYKGGISVNVWEKFKRLFHDLQLQAHRDGWRQTGCWLFGTLVSLPYCRVEYTVFARSLVEPLPTVEPRMPVSLCLATEADLARFRGLVPPSELRHFARRLAHGRYCFLALDGENLAAYCWASTQVEFDIDNLEMQLRPGDAYVDDAYTVPAYRRQRIQTVVHLFRLGYMRDLGCRRAILIVDDKNIASQGLVRKLGYQDVDHLSYRRVLWKRTYSYQHNMEKEERRGIPASTSDTALSKGDRSSHPAEPR
jgi:ribosomal protein S18 acetylase RimI-like enzyme